MRTRAWGRIVGGVVIGLAIAARAEQEPAPPPAAAFDAVLANPPARAAEESPWTGVWRGTLRGRESIITEAPPGKVPREFNDAKQDDLVLVFLQRGRDTWIDGPALQVFWQDTTAAGRPTRLVVDSAHPDQATGRVTAEAYGGKLKSTFTCRATLSNDTVRLIVRLRNEGEIPPGTLHSLGDKPMPINYSLDGAAMLTRGGTTPRAGGP